MLMNKENGKKSASTAFLRQATSWRHSRQDSSLLVETPTILIMTVSARFQNPNKKKKQRYQIIRKIRDQPCQTWTTWWPNYRILKVDLVELSLKDHPKDSHQCKTLKTWWEWVDHQWVSLHHTNHNNFHNKSHSNPCTNHQCNSHQCNNHRWICINHNRIRAISQSLCSIS